MRYALVGIVGAILFAYATPAVAPASYPQLSPAQASDLSYNWAGYVAQDSGPYTGVSGRWLVPKISGTGTAADAAWVGIGGVASDDLIQAGTQAIVDPDGAVSYEAWLELMPAPSVPLSINIEPGDEVAVEIEEDTPGQWTVTFSDYTSGQNYRTQVSYDSSLSSAEWIEEMPATLGGGFIPLDDFGSMRFLAGSATVGGTTKTIGQLGGQSLSMINRQGQLLAATSVLSDPGGFIVSRSDAQPTPRRSPSRYGLPRGTYR